MSTFFDDVTDDLSSAEPSKPFWSLDLENEKEVLDWLRNELAFLKKDREERDRQMYRNLALYKGIQYMDQDRPDIRERAQERTQAVKKIVANNIYELVQQKTARVIKYKPAVSVLPTHDELSDKAAAKANKQLLDHIWYTQDFENIKAPTGITLKQIFGESALFVDWDEDKGDLHPDWDGEKKIPLLGEDGEPVKNEDGSTKYIERPVRVGDVVCSVDVPINYYFERKSCFEDVNFYFRRKLMPVEEARMLFPSKSSEIKAGENAMAYDFYKMALVPVRNEVEVWEFYHKRTRGLDKGRRVYFTNEVVLTNRESPFEFDTLACARITDIEVPGELYGRSGIENVKSLTSSYNNMLNMALRNMIMVSHPKWMMPAGAAKKESLGNDITIVEYKGPIAPQLVQANPSPNELYNFMDKLQDMAQKIYGVYGVSRGDVPAGIKSGIALQYLAEQESERMNIDIIKFNQWILECAKLMLSIAGSYYDPSDKRYVRVLGRDNQWTSRFFDAANLSKSYEIKIQNSSALPASRAQRTQYIVDLNEQFPGLFTREQVVEMLDLGSSDKYVNDAVANIRTAQAENEMILDNEGTDSILSPEPQEDHIMHWKVHVRSMQEYAFKFTVPEAQKERMRDMVRAHEMYMVEYAAKNPLYAQKLAELEGFPLFYSGVAAPVAGIPQGQPQGGMSEAVAVEQQAPVQEAIPSLTQQAAPNPELALQEVPQGPVIEPSAQ
jgi:hypothetical protein